MRGSLIDRLGHAWRVLEREQRRAALASIGLFVSMFLPWYSKTDTVVVRNAARAAQTSSSAFQAFSFVEAAVLLVSAGVLALLFGRAERRRFQLPGGDGLIVMIAGGWAALLIFIRLIDKPGLQGNQRVTATVGVQWGIFIALLLALALLYAGARMRASERPQPPFERPGGEPSPREDRRPAANDHRRPAADPPASARETIEERTQVVPAGAPRPARGRPRYPPAPSGQLSFEDPPGRAE